MGLFDASGAVSRQKGVILHGDETLHRQNHTLPADPSGGLRWAGWLCRFGDRKGEGAR